MRGGKGAWKGLREMQRGRAGLRPSQFCAVKDCDGELCIGQDNTLKRWHQHFSAVLNICSTFNPSVVEATVQHPVRVDLAEPPTEEEIMQAIGRLKCGREGGKSGILPEMVKGCGGEMMDHIIDLFATVWREEEVPQDWRDALLVPIPKKGDLTQCDNWRGSACWIVWGRCLRRSYRRGFRRLWRMSCRTPSVAFEPEEGALT